MRKRNCILVWVVFVLLKTTLCSDPPLKSLFIDSDSPYETGYQLGMLTKPYLGDFLAGYPSLDALLDYVHNHSDVYDSFLSTSRTLYPDFVFELEGMADAYEIPFETVFAITISQEIDMLMLNESNGMQLIEGVQCSDILVKTIITGTGELILGHNEDMEKVYRNTSFLVSVHQRNGENFAKAPVSRFSTLFYMAQPPADSFLWNSAGVAFTINTIFPKDVVVGGVPVAFLYRDMANSFSVQDLLNKITNGVNVASGFSVNVISHIEQKVLNVEVGPGKFIFSVEYLDSFWKRSDHHFNMFKRLDVKQHYDNSTIGRETAANTHRAPASVADVQDILGDVSNPKWPIYRTAVPPDPCLTVATVIFDGKRGIVKIFRGNPSIQEEIYQFPLDITSESYDSYGINAFKYAFFVVLLIILIIVIVVFFCFVVGITVMLIMVYFVARGRRDFSSIISQRDESSNSKYEVIMNNS